MIKSRRGLTAVLTIVDTFSRFSPALEPRFSCCGAHVVEVLERVGRAIGSQRRSGSIEAPSLCRYFPRPGKPTDNAFIDFFNGKFRVEC